MTTSNRKSIIDIKTPNKSYPLPNLKNPLQTDVQRIIKSFEKIDADIHELDSHKLDQTGGRISGNIGRTAHDKGCFVGGYNNLGSSSSYTNPIFSIGDNYLPNETDLNDFYGIGFSSGVSSFIPYISYHSWGLYVAASGVARVFLDGNKGNIYAEADAYVQGGKKKVATEEYADQKFLPLDGGNLKGDLKITTGSNQDAHFKLFETDNHGFELLYAGADSNVTHFRTYNTTSTPVDFMTVSRGSKKPDFKDTPTVKGKKVAMQSEIDALKKEVAALKALITKG